ncbi:uncharacterized protein DS421_12g372230 [Arachis hypogaea]|nr:uncharacterized protein DS421_12g372230 [Arachis hypogaea]
MGVSRYLLHHDGERRDQRTKLTTDVSTPRRRLMVSDGIRGAVSDGIRGAVSVEEECRHRWFSSGWCDGRTYLGFDEIVTKCWW